MNDICSVMDPECCNSFQIWLGTFRVSDPSYVIEVIFGIFFFKHLIINQQEESTIDYSSIGLKL